MADGNGTEYMVDDSEAHFSPLKFPVCQDDALMCRPASNWEYEDRRGIQMIIPRIFLGPLAVCRRPEFLQAHQITMLVYVMNHVTQTFFERPYLSNLPHKTIMIDEGSILTHIAGIKALVDTWLQETDGNILFLDPGGNDMAAIPICAYMMDTQRASFTDVYAYLRTKRLSVTFTNTQQFQLNEFTTWLTARNCVVSHVYSEAENSRGNLRRKHDAEDESEAGRSDLPSARFIDR